MNIVLHISDFHININKVVTKQRIEELIKEIKKQQININTIVFTGDVIDSKTIVNDTIKETNYDESCSDDTERIIFRKRLIENTKKEFDFAIKIFEHLLFELSVSNDDLIICCGNHDRIRISTNNGETSNCIKDFDAFECYDYFCNLLKIRYTHNTTIQKSNGYSYLICNTNWNIKNKNSVCFDCNEVISHLQQLENKEKSIFVSHQPIKDFCEEKYINYSTDYANDTILKKIKEKCSVSLFGDKHGQFNNNDLFLESGCGAPLCEEGICYNILKGDDSINKGKLFLYKQIILVNGIWKIVPILDNIKELHDISTKFFSVLTKQYLLSKSCSNYEILSDLFKNICKVKDVINSNNYVDLSQENIFDFIITNLGHKNNSINIKGAPKMGKTFFSNILYLKLFEEYKSGNNNIYPFYFNIDKLINHNITSYNSFLTIVLKEFHKYLLKLDGFKEKYDCEILIIIDGFNQKQIFMSKDTIESQIYNIMNNNKYKFIMISNITDFPKQDNIIPSLNINCNYILYFNLIDLVPVNKESNKALSIIKNLVDIYYNDTVNADTFYDFLLDLHIIITDLRSIYRFIRYYANGLNRMDNFLIKAINEDKTRILNKNKIDAAKEFAYKMLFLGSVYSEKEIIDFYSFYKMKNNKMLLNYLCAEYYILEINRIINEKENKFSRYAFISQFIPRDISLLIKTILQIDYTNLLSTYIQYFIDNNIIIPYTAHSMIYYLAAKNGNKYLFEKAKSIKSESIWTNDIDKSDFFKFCVERSFYIGAGYLGINTKKYSFVDKILKDEKKREYNRMHQLLYYGDNAVDGYGQRCFNYTKDVIQKGFDFHNTFLTIIYKYDYYKKHKKEYNLMEYDLVTLCDLIYTRLSCTKINNSEMSTLFYYSGYNNSNSNISSIILTRFTKILEDYLSQIKIKNYTIYYFKLILNMSKKAYEELYKKYPQEKNNYLAFVNPTYELEKIFKTIKYSRIGWNIDSAGGIKECERKKLIENNNTVKESIAEHILESVYIAMFFLPEKPPETINSSLIKYYNKNTIINMLLLHEIGKYNINDYPPNCDDTFNLERKYKDYLLQILVLGSTSGFSDLSMYYNEMEQYLNKKDSINSKIAYQINVIQREYKYKKLLGAGLLKFSDDRKCEFEKDFQELREDLCEKIRAILIDNNSNF